MKPADQSVLHKLLQRQLKKHCNLDLLSHPQFVSFVEAVNESYQSFEKDKEISEHAFALSEEEFVLTNQKLREEVELRKLSIHRLKQTLGEISNEFSDGDQWQDHDLLTIVDLLNKEVSKRREAEEESRLAKEQAEKASHAKSDFLSVMSHEIRTPLNAVIGMGHLLLKNDPRPDQLKNLQVLKTSADNLLVLVNDILDFNKIEAGKLELETAAFHVKKMIRDISGANSIIANEKRNRISVFIDEHIPETLVGDSTRLGQVLNNLVSNAVKFTESGRIDIMARLEDRNEESCRIYFSVEDTGIGIAPDKLESVFQPFTQASTSINRRFGGTGLGLSISQCILVLMGSKLEVKSQPGKGSCFFFTLELPLDLAKKETENKTGQEAYNLNGRKILLVEDTLFNVLFATQLLEGWGAEVDVAENGAIAVDMLHKNTYDLVLMDLQMPVMDGYTATVKMREFNTETPVIALTASATSNVREKVMRAGMQDYVTKPFNPDDFIMRLKKYI